MVRTTAEISGMICGMCEAHINDAVRKAFSVKKVRSSRAKGETVIESEQPIDPEKLKRAVNSTGYVVLSVRQEKMVREASFKNVFSGLSADKKRKS